MKKVIIPFFVVNSKWTIEDIAVQLDQFPRNHLEYSLWEKPKVKPEVSFVLAYNEGNLFLKFYVKEPNIRAVQRQINAEVYRDSCVEFFVSFGNDMNYHNLEFNCAGTCLGQFGPDKQQRRFISAQLLKSIQVQTRLTKYADDGLHPWELTAKIPTSVFTGQENHIDKNDLRVNFYKCGDDLDDRHYLAWNYIDSLEPDFHLPEYFGIGKYE